MYYLNMDSGTLQGIESHFSYSVQALCIIVKIGCKFFYIYKYQFIQSAYIGKL